MHTTHTTSQQCTRRLRVGVIIGSLKAPAWVRTILEDLRISSAVDLTLLIVSGEESSVPRWSSALFRCYAALDYRLFKARSDAFATARISPELRVTPTLEVAPATTGGVCHLGSSDLVRIQQADLDVIIDLGPREIPHRLPECARYGVWSLHHGVRLDSRGPGLFWRMHDRDPVTETSLEITTAGRSGRQVVYQSFARTDFISLYRGSNAAYWKTTQFVKRRLEDLHRYGGENLASLNGPLRACDDARPAGCIPGNLTTARFLMRQLLLLLRNQIRTRLFHEQWFVAIRRREDKLSGPAVMTGFRSHIPPGDRFYADPFLFKRGTATYLFFEDYPYASAKGVISCTQAGPGGLCDFDEPKVVLDRDYHLSYPFVFEWEGEVYMIPETRDNRTVELYRAVQFPHQWSLEKVLMDGVVAVDATLFEQDGKFWLFLTMAVEGGSVNDELFLFRADSPLGPWEPHPQNPIVSDVRRARPAGRLFVQDGQLIRPSQDCSVRYGAAIWFNRVDALSETEYRETPIARIDPDWLPGNLASHTYNRDEDWEVVDGQVPREKAWWAGGRMRTGRGVGSRHSGYRSVWRALASLRRAPAQTADAPAAGTGGK